MTVKATEILNSAKSAWVILAGIACLLFWIYGVADNAADAKEMAIQANSKADTALKQNSDGEVRMAELKGKLDVTNTKLDALNLNIERLFKNDR